MAPPRVFARNIRRTARRIQSNATKVNRKVALAVLQAVVVATPVDTGRARSNWNTSLIVPDKSTRDAYSPGAGGSTGGPNAAAAIASGRSTIASARSERTPIWISNNLPYIGRLNEGSSAQAPANFIEQAVAAGRAAVRGSRLLRDG